VMRSERLAENTSRAAALRMDCIDGRPKEHTNIMVVTIA